MGRDRELTEIKARSRSGLTALAVLFLIIALGEAYALFLEYENNRFLQQYVAENYQQLLVRSIGLLVLASGAAYLVYLTGRAGPATRIGRFSRKVVGFSPIVSFLTGLALWPLVVSKVVGTSTIGFEVYAVLLLLAITLGMMLGDRITVRMSFRNFTRRKTSMAIVITGLMIGTAMISGSLVTGDTLTELFTRGAYFGYGYADEVVYARNITTFGYQYFIIGTYRALASQLAGDPLAGPNVLGITPEIIETVSVNNTNKGLIQSPATLIGTFSNASQTLGEFHSSSRAVIPSDFGDGEAILNDRAARDLNATVGDTIAVYSARILSFRVVGIAVSDARADFSQNDNVFVTMNAAQQLANRTGFINFVAVTNIGGLRDSIQYSQTVGLAANRTLNALLAPTPGFECKTSPSQVAGPAVSLCAYAAKQAAVDSATTSARNLSNFFIVLSSFAVIAGVVLIVNIFVMLAEERKSEMGMARAVGMRRGQLTKMFLFEGSLYAAGAALAGTFTGIAIAYAVLYVFGTIITTFFPVNLSQVLASFTFTPSSLFTAFAEGLAITYFTILITSWRVSKLNIIRAIRNSPEPPRGVRTYTLLLVLGIGLVVAGALLFRDSFTARSALEALIAPSLVIIGAGLVMSRFFRNRYAFTIAGLALLVQWGVPSLSWNNPLIQNYSFGPELYFAGGVLMVVGGILVVMYNTDVVLKGLRLFYRGRKTLTPIFRTALAYPENKRFRTAATVMMFALVIFTVSAIASIAAEQSASLDTIVKQDSGGYDLIAQTYVPVPSLGRLVNADSNLDNHVAAVIGFNTTVLLSARDLTTGQVFDFPALVGADPNAPAQSNFFTGNTFQMVNKTLQYSTASDVWNAVMTNPSNVVWSFGFVNTRGPPQEARTPNPGDVLELTGQGPGGGPVKKTVTVLGILNGVFFDGIVGTNELLANPFGVGTGTLSFIKVASGVDPVDVSNILRRDFVNLKMQTVVIPVVIGDFVQIGQSFLGLFEGFLGLGLVVGIAGLGILSIRSVVERRQEIGILRALGFRRRMVLGAFVLENSYISFLGIIIGVVLGVNLGYAFAVSPNSGINFVLPWQAILEIVGISYSLALLATITSARRAASVPPAEALRYFE